MCSTSEDQSKYDCSTDNSCLWTKPVVLAFLNSYLNYCKVNGFHVWYNHLIQWEEIVQNVKWNAHPPMSLECRNYLKHLENKYVR